MATESSEMIYFCTYFDANYLPRALAMYNSLLHHCRDFHIYMLCFDDLSIRHLQSLNLKHATLISIEEFEAGDEKLITTKKDRTRLEYYYTCGPSLPIFVFNNYSEIDSYIEENKENYDIFIDFIKKNSFIHKEFQFFLDFY